MTTFVLPLCQCLAWPMSAFLIAFLFKQEVKQAFSRMGQLRYQGLEISFREDLREAECLASMTNGMSDNGSRQAMSARKNLELLEGDLEPAVGGARGSLPSSTSLIAAAEVDMNQEIGRRSDNPVLNSVDNGPTPPAELLRISRRDSRKACLNAWSNLVETLQEASGRCGNRRVNHFATVDSDAKFLVARGWLLPDEKRLIERLFELTEQIEVEANFSPTTADARRFIELVYRIIERLSGIG